MTGQMVPNALDRIDSDKITFTDEMKEPLTTQVKAALEAGLAVEAQNRIQSVGELLTRLRVENSQPDKRINGMNSQEEKSAGEDNAITDKSSKRKLWIGAAAMVFIGILAVVIAVGGRGKEEDAILVTSDGGSEQSEAEAETEMDYDWDLPVAHEKNFSYETEEDGEGVVITGYTGNMTSFQIPGKIEGKPIVAIGKDAFSGSVVEEIGLPRGVKRIEDTAFAFCKELRFVGLPEGLEDIRYGAFSDCGSLVEIEFPESLVTISAYAFHMTALSRIYIPANIATVEYGAFSVASNAGLTEFVVSSENRFFEVYGGALYRRRVNASNEPLPGELEILVAVPTGTTGYFAIPDGVTGIENCAFHYCRGLTSVYVPASVTSINEACFDKAVIGKLTVSEECQLPKDSSFALNINRYADYSWGLPVAAEQDFQYETEENETGVVITGYTGSMTSFEIPTELAGSPVVAIGKDAFNSSAVEEVGLPKGLQKIGAGAFFACKELRFIGLPEGLKDIGGDAFNYCNHLTEIDLPESLEIIRLGAFSNTSLARVHIPANVEIIEGAAFAASFEAGFTQFTVSDNNRFFKVNEGILYERQRDSSGKTILGGSEYLIAVPSGLTGSLVIPDNVTELHAYVFYNCQGLTEVYVPESVSEISEFCFYNTAIGELTVSKDCQLPEDTSFASVINRY